MSTRAIVYVAMNVINIHVYVAQIATNLFVFVAKSAVSIHIVINSVVSLAVLSHVFLYVWFVANVNFIYRVN